MKQHPLHVVVFLIATLLGTASAHEKLAIESGVKSSEWTIDLPLGAAVQPLGDALKISNRAYLSREGYKPCTIKVAWKPTNLPAESDDPSVKTDANIRLYGDHLAFVLATTVKEVARVPGGRGGEAADGIIVKIDAGGGNVWIRVPQVEKPLGHVILSREEGKPAISAEFHSLAISDDGEKIVVNLDGKVILEAVIPAEARKGTRWGIYNREPVGPPGPHISDLKDLTLN